jgi:regulator of protease activity HflC (stomatin/prohibitin superfamily)
MGWIILTILLALVAGVALIVAVGAKSTAVADGKAQMTDTRAIGIGVTGLAGVVWLVATLLYSGTQVPAGHIGVKYVFGKIVGTVQPGLHFVAPWAKVINANTQVQAYTFTNLTSFSRETQNLDVTATLNYSVNPGDVRALYTNVGQDWFQKLVGTRVNQFFKDETVKFRAVNIAPNRDRIRKDVRARLRLALAPYSVNVEDLLIDNIQFSPAFTQAIDDKQIAIQQAQAAKNRVATAKAEAQQIIATAEGQARANLLKRQTLTQLLVEQNAIDKLNPNVQVIMVPTGSSFLLPNLLNGTTSGKP